MAGTAGLSKGVIFQRFTDSPNTTSASVNVSPAVKAPLRCNCCSRMPMQWFHSLSRWQSARDRYSPGFAPQRREDIAPRVVEFGCLPVHPALDAGAGLRLRWQQVIASGFAHRSGRLNSIPTAQNRRRSTPAPWRWDSGRGRRPFPSRQIRCRNLPADMQFRLLRRSRGLYAH